MPKIRFGSTINQINLITLQGLLKVCQDRVLIDLDGTDLISIYQKSPQKELLTYTNVDQMSKEDTEYLFQLQQSRQNQLLKFLLNQNDLLLTANSPDELTLSRIALLNRDGKLLELLCTLEGKSLKVFEDQLLNWDDSEKKPGKKEEYSMQLMNTLDMEIWTVLATNTTLFTYIWDHMNYEFFDKKSENDPSLFHKSLKFWHSRFGPSIPPEIVKSYNFYGQNTGRDFMQTVS